MILNTGGERGLFSTSGRWFRKFPLLAALAVWGAVLGANGAAAGEVKCDTLINQAIKTGETYRVTIDVDRKAVRIESAKGKYCYESIPAWTMRQLPMAGGEEKASPSPSVPPSDLLVPEGTGSEEDYAARRLPPVRPPCDRELDRYWQQKSFKIKGTLFWLVRVYTVDVDGDGFTDDVGFKLEAEGGESIGLRYFDPDDKQSVRNLPSLKLPEDGDVFRLCFAQISFEIPDGASTATGISIEMPNLAQEMAERTGTGKKPEKNPGKESKGESFGFWGWFVIMAILATLIAVTVGAFLTRRLWLPKITGGGGKGDEDEEDEDDWEDD